MEPMPYLDRDYQRRAVLAVEAALQRGSRSVLHAMATGTGTTRTCIGLCYRLLKTKRFRRLLFLVQCNALGEQTANAQKDIRLEAQQPSPRSSTCVRPERATKLEIRSRSESSRSSK